MGARRSYLRMARIHALIAGGSRPSAARLAADLEVSRRTVERDLEAMRDELGAPLVYDRRSGGYYYSAPSFQLPLVNLTESEAAMLVTAAKLIEAYSGTPYRPVIERALRKLESLAAPAPAAGLEPPISFHLEPLRGDETRVQEHFAVLGRARALGRTVEMEYYSASSDRATTRRIDPYELHRFSGAWYVVGWCHTRKQIRTFALDRIFSLRETTDCFVPPADFSVARHYGDAMGLEHGEPVAVELWFDAYQARWIRERVWHSSQQLREGPDGCLWMSLRVGSLQQVKRWVLSMGSHARVLAPPELRLAVARELREATQAYEGETTEVDLRLPAPAREV